ncbi:MAG: Nitric oxide reductase [Deltaproteobacteria bacterium ADurb.Bin510]|nr:MAG: Nitric oxide reductase [Deltaproteobacteria bacterium ADurb.Bin510]
MKAVVLYDTMWQSTAKLARAIEEGLIAGGAGVRLMGLHAAHRSEVAYEVLEAGALVVGSPTLNNNIFPSLADALTYLKGLRPKNLVGAAFGSYGWGGEAPKQVAEILDAMQVEQVDAPLRVQYVPDAAALEAAYELGHKVAARLKEACCGN